MNGISAKDFSKDMGFSLKRIVLLESTAIECLAAYGGLSARQLQELISWTGQSIGDVRMSFRGETFVSRALRNPVIRGCPICLREDAQAGDDKPLKFMAMRGDWQLREVGICVRHSHPLIPLWEQQVVTDRYDLSHQLLEILPEVLSGKFDQPAVEPSPYDLWLDDRLQTGADKTWLAKHSLYATTTFCRLLGAEILRVSSTSNLTPEERLRLAQAKGYEVARRGKGPIQSALNALAAIANGPGDEPKKAFAGLYTHLSQDYLREKAFAPFRKILRDCIVDIWPVAAGEEVLGFVQTERKLHSIKSAATEAGVGGFLLEQFLIKDGALSADDNRPTARKTFDATLHKDLLAEIPTLIGPIEMQREIGATRAQFASLVADGLLKPVIDIPTIKSPWRRSDGSALIAELHALATPVAPSDKAWEGVQQAKTRSKISVGRIIDEARAGRLQMGQRTDLPGYAGFCVQRNEIDQISPLKDKLADYGYLTAAAFGRTVGMRDKGRFLSLVAAEHTPATILPHPRTGVEQTYVTQADIDAFRSRFMTTTTMAAEFGLDRRSVVAKLKAYGIAPFSPNGEDYGSLYLREDVRASMF